MARDPIQPIVRVGRGVDLGADRFLAVAKLGAICVPLNWRLVPDELEFILADAGVSTLIFGDEFLAAVTDLEARPKLRGEGSDATHIQRYLQVGGELAPFAEDYTATCENAPDDEPEIGACDADELYIMYTSGTTGLPKGAVIPRRAIAAGLDGLADAWGWTSDDTLAHGLPLFHVHGLILGVLGALRTGAKLVHTGRPTPERYAAAGASMYFGVPTVWHRVVGSPAHARALAGTRVLVSGSAALPVPVFDQLRELTGQFDLVEATLDEVDLSAHRILAHKVSDTLCAMLDRQLACSTMPRRLVPSRIAS